ncbi:MAG TPA: HD domain-containing protein [Abditibacteriaceae bacterium]
MTISEQTQSAESLRTFLLEGREALLKQTPAIDTARPWLEGYTALIDETLQRIYQSAWRTALDSPAGVHCNDSKPDSAQVPEQCEVELALLAIGGYGRGELCPHSDIDIAFVPSEEDNPLLDAVIKEAFRLIVEVFIDGAKLEVGYAYRPISDCAHLDGTAKSALLESRLLAGSARLTQRLHTELAATWDAVAFLLEKTHERREVSRRIRFNLYSVEPNLKEGTGALRDIQTALWVAGAMLKTNEPMKALEHRGVVTQADCRAAQNANEFLLKLRVWLHLTTGKKNDTLRVEYQNRCARDFGYAGSGALPSQRLLEDLYYHAEAALRFSEKVMRRLIDGPLPLDEHFVSHHQLLRAAHPYTLTNHPELLMRPFALSRKYGFAIDSELDRQVDEAIPKMEGKARRHESARKAFLELVARPDDAADALTELRARGILGRFIPEFDAMLHLAPADPSHELTVGEHSIYAVRRLGEMWKARGDDAALFGVWDGVDDVELLVLATLFHDAGKIEAGTDHSISGERIARDIGARLALTPPRIDRLALLVRRHLLLPRVARLRDLSAPGTIREVMEHVGDVPTLKMLYLLSLADTRAVGERSYSNLELHAMEDLYERTLLAMTSEETAQRLTDSEMREQMIQRERERLRREMRKLPVDDATLQRLTENLPASYVLNTPLPTVATHLRFLEQLPQEKVIVDFYQGAEDVWTQMTIVAYDDPQPGLLAKICGAVWAAGFEIHTAQVFTLRGETLDVNDSRDIVLDLLQVARDGRALSSAQSARLAASLREILLGENSVENVLKAAGKANSAPLSPHRIGVRNDLSDEHSVLTIVNDNVPGLLFYLTRVLASLGLDIHSAKITTWGGRGEDAFYVTRRTDERDEKVPDDAIKDLLENLRRRLQKPK